MLLPEGSACLAIRIVGIVNCLAQNSLDLTITAQVLSQRMPRPTEGAQLCLKRGIRWTALSPREVLGVVFGLELSRRCRRVVRAAFSGMAEQCAIGVLPSRTLRIPLLRRS